MDEKALLDAIMREYRSMAEDMLDHLVEDGYVILGYAIDHDRGLREDRKRQYELAEMGRDVLDSGEELGYEDEDYHTAMVILSCLEKNEKLADDEADSAPPAA